MWAVVVSRKEGSKPAAAALLASRTARRGGARRPLYSYRRWAAKDPPCENHRPVDRELLPPDRSDHHPQLDRPRHRRSAAVRFLNPWVDLADVTPDAVLEIKVESVTRTFGVVGALMCSLSVAALALAPPRDNGDDGEERTRRPGREEEEAERTFEESTVEECSIETKNDNDDDNNHHRGFLAFARGIWTRVIATTDHPEPGTCLLVRWGVIPESELSHCYAACCAASFYSSVCAMGLSAVINAWLACTPVGGTRRFVRYHSLTICAIPGFLAAATGLAGVALFIGLDRTQGTPVSYIGLGGTVAGGLLIGSATARGMVCTHRLLAPLAKQHRPKQL